VLELLKADLTLSPNDHHVAIIAHERLTQA